MINIAGYYLNNIDTIKIGGVSAIKISSTNFSLVAMVMPGAVSGKIYLTNSSGNAISVNNFIKTNSVPPSVQQGSKLVGTGNVGGASQGSSVSVSADGNTAVVGGHGDDVGKGAVWIYVRNGGVWSQQGNKLVGTGTEGQGTINQGASVDISADGNTVIVGGYTDNGSQGAVWIFTRSSGVWSQQGSKLVGTGSIGMARQGVSVSISADGNTAVAGGWGDNSIQGATWVFTRSAGIWSQQGNKLIGTGNIGAAGQGGSVAISANGNTVIVGGNADSIEQGAAWVFYRIGNVWSQQGNKLVGLGSIGRARQGYSVSLSADGNTAIIGSVNDSNNKGAVWVFTRSGGVWNQQGNKLVGTGGVGSYFNHGMSICLSADGNIAIVGGNADNSDQEATWVYTRSGGVWSQKGNKLVGTGGIGTVRQGKSVSLSADGNTAFVGGVNDNGYKGAAWVFTGAPTISTNSSLAPFSACSANNSNPQSFTVEGTGLSSGNLLIAAPAGFEISTSMGSGYGSSINLTPISGTVVNTTIYARLSSSAIGNPTGNIVCSASNATSQNISVTGTVNPPPTIGTITGNATPASISSPFTYSVSNQPNSTYFWLATNGTIQSGQGTNAVNVVWPRAGTGNLNAKITNSNNCTDSTVLPINITNVGINSLSLENDLTVYPNPTKSNITITNKTNIVGKKYIITNLVGQTILSGKLNLNETIVNLEALQSGMYFLSLDGMSKQSIKVIKE